MKDAYYTLPYCSQSSLKVFMHSKLEYKHQFVDRLAEKRATSAMSCGSLAHCMLLEPALLDKKYAYFDEAERPDNTKTFAATVNKAWKQNLEAEALLHGICLVSKAMWDQADAMVQKLCDHELASDYIFPDIQMPRFTVYKELDILWQNECSELQLKSKLDLLLVDTQLNKVTVVDYKTSSAVTLQEFGWSVKKYGYDIQAAYYQDAARYWLEEHYPGVEFTIQVLFIPQKSSAPYQVLGVVELDAATMQKAREKYERALQELEGCLHTGIWEENVGVQVLNLSGGDVPLPELSLEETPLPWM